MKKYILLAFFLPMVVCTCLLLFLDCYCDLNLSKVYIKNFRAPFFTAFLTAGSFMLSFMSIVLFTFSSKLFEDTEYIKTFKKLKEDLHHKSNFYSPLINLGKVFMICVLSCIITSVSQITIGYIKCYICRIICISLACTTFFLVFFLLYHFSINLMEWFKLLEDKGKKI